MTGALLFKGRYWLATIFFLFLSASAWAQLAPFTLQVTAINETCTANGVLNFTSVNTTAGATILYKVYHLPDLTTPIVVTSLNTFTGLVAGNYRVVATQSLGNESNIQQQDAVIVSEIINLQYTVSGLPEQCGSDGQIIVNVTVGTPVWYELFAGPVIRPLQSSNVFENLPSGQYSVRVFDDCGEGVATTYTIFQGVVGLFVHDHTSYGEKVSCTTIQVNNYLQSSLSGGIFFPVTIKSTVFPPSGPPLVFTQMVTNGSTFAPFSFQIPMLPSGSYTYNVLVTDACGNTFTQNNIPILLLPMNVEVELIPQGCFGQLLRIRVLNHVNPVTINFTSAPAGFNPILYNSLHPGPFSPGSYAIPYYNPNVLFLQGNYSVLVTDACGTTATTSFSITQQPIPPTYIDSRVQPSCEPGLSTLMLGFQNEPVISGQLTQAPAAFGQPLPMNIQPYLYVNAKIYMAGLPPGQYVFDLVNQCGVHIPVTINITPLVLGALEVSLHENCNSFDLRLDQYPGMPATYWLQKLNSDGEWGHPGTGVTLSSGLSAVNARQVYLNSWNGNLQYSGSFRIMRFVQSFGNGTPYGSTCTSLYHSFEFIVGPKILDVYSFVCDNGTYDAVVSATGYAPLRYRITTKNGQPFAVNNNFSNVFLGLQPAIYNFQVEDGCGNILNSLFDISQPAVFEVTAAEFCEGTHSSLSVPEFPFLSYQWWKDGNSTNILNNTHQLSFASFNPATDNGIYHIRVFYAGNPNSCIDYVIDYQINVSSNLPNAGTGQSVSYCGSQGMIDLFGLLLGEFDPSGSWTETTASGALTNSIWNSATVDPGNYQFNYTVNGACNAIDLTTVNIIIKPQPESPLASFDAPACETGTLALAATAISFGTYQWNGPNGFASNEQNPVITNLSSMHNGTYSVKSSANGCESEWSSVEVNVGKLPQLTLQAGCENNRFKLNAVAQENSFDPSLVTYHWTGPNQFIASENPIDITQAASGLYEVTVTTPEGCSAAASVNISSTFCNVPPGISPNGDNKNDILDLTGMEVMKFKIFNRYGRMVFEQDNYTNQWHGQDLNGKELPDATYYYYISQKTGEEKTGWVYVTR